MATALSHLRARLRCDLRALAALRIACGALVLLDLGMRARDLVAFHTDQGILPRVALHEMSPVLGRLSLHAWGGSAAYEGTLLALAAALAVALLAGYRSRTAAAASALMLGSLLARNPIILNTGDSLLLFLLFWCAFLPVGARWSLDERAARRAAASHQPAGEKAATPPLVPAARDVAGGAPGAAPRTAAEAAPAAGPVAGLLGLVVLVYLTNAVFKTRADGWEAGTAMRFVFGAQEYTTATGRALAAHGDLLAILGWAWLGLLWASPLLLLARGATRTWLALAYAAAHAAMLASMRLGLFPLVSVAALLPFLHAGFWDAAQRTVARLARVGRQPVCALADVHGATVRVAPSDPVEGKAGARPGDAAAAVAIAALLVWAGLGLGYIPAPEAASGFVERHGRGWAMFARPREAQVWLVAPGTLEDGSPVDALHGAATPWDSPAELRAWPDIRWHTYKGKVHAGNPGLAPLLAAYLCHAWNAEGHAGAAGPTGPPAQGRLAGFTLTRMERPIVPDGPDPAPVAHELLRHTCA